MWQDLKERVISCAEFIAQTGCTVRACSARFSVSKSTVHKDVTERLPLIDKALYAKVRKILDKNLSERHLRGGNATKTKYEKKKRDIGAAKSAELKARSAKECGEKGNGSEVLSESAMAEDGKRDF